MSRALYAWLFSTLDGCLPFRTLLDTEDGLRRMDRAEIAEYQKMVAFGRCTQGEAPGFPHGPIILESVLFSIWVRPETPDPGDLLLEDITLRILRAIVYSERPPITNQDCVNESPGAIIMDAVLQSPIQEPILDDEMQAWTKSFRILFTVNIATCKVPIEWCIPCPEIANGSNGDAEPPSEAELETAFFEVFPLQENLAGEFDLYVCHPLINTANFDANPNVTDESIKLYYGTTSLVLNFASQYWQDIIGVTVESDYWHLDGIMDEAHRIPHPDNPNLWLVKPSASLGARIANKQIEITSDYFGGIYADESGPLPDHYWNAFKTAGGADAVTDADRPFWETQWDAMHEQYVTTWKGHHGSSKAFVANAALRTNAKWDGKTTEASHIVLAGEAAARASFEEQSEFWTANPDRYGDHPLNVAWDYPDLQTAGEIAAGTTAG